MKQLLLTTLSILVLAFASCNKEDTANYGDLPETVKQHIDSRNCGCDPRIGLFKWNDRMLYVYHAVGPACNTIPYFYDTDGKKVELSQEEAQDFWSNNELIEMIWVCGE